MTTKAIFLEIILMAEGLPESWRVFPFYICIYFTPYCIIWHHLSCSFNAIGQSLWWPSEQCIVVRLPTQNGSGQKTHAQSTHIYYRAGSARLTWSTYAFPAPYSPKSFAARGEGALMHDLLWLKGVFWSKMVDKRFQLWYLKDFIVVMMAGAWGGLERRPGLERGCTPFAGWV